MVDSKWLISSNKKFRIAKHPTGVAKIYRSDEEYEAQLNTDREQVSALQEKLFAEKKHSLLIVLQGMDTSGKDGLIKSVMTGLNPQGVHIVSFKQPSHEELSHDFLWRTHLELPARGKIGIFNRSYFEEVVVTKVHPEILEGQGLPETGGKNFWEHRLEDINNHEQYLTRQGWRILKIFLHISKAEQKNRLLARINDPEKQWKFEYGDIVERESWSKYQSAYEECFQETSTKRAPWYVLPADDKKNARLFAMRILRDTLVDMDPQIPKADSKKKSEISKAAKVLNKH